MESEDKKHHLVFKEASQKLTVLGLFKKESHDKTDGTHVVQGESSAQQFLGYIERCGKHGKNAGKNIASHLKSNKKTWQTWKFSKELQVQKLPQNRNTTENEHRTIFVQVHLNLLQIATVEGASSDIIKSVLVQAG